MDIMKAAGLQSPDISILSDEFLAEVREMRAKRTSPSRRCKKLINGEVQVPIASATSRRQSCFPNGWKRRLPVITQRLTTVAGAGRTNPACQGHPGRTRSRGEETGLSDEEIAFYDALAENESAREAMGEPALRVIAHELVTVLQGQRDHGLDAS